MFYPLYRFFFWPLAHSAFRLLALSNEKVKRGLAMRKRLPEGVPPWLAWERGQRPIWIHCASFEFEYAKPVISLLKSRRSDIKVLVTYFSPTLATAAAKFPGVDFACPSPWDEATVLREFIAHHRPRALLIARTDTWPEMLRQAKAAGIPTLLFSATLPPESGRAKGIARWMSREVFHNIDDIYCVSEDDRATFAGLGFEANSRVAGDTRYDQTLARLRSPRPVKDELFSGTKDNVLIAGSTWEEDEEVLLEAATLARGIRLVIVPHEPTPEHLAKLESACSSRGLSTARYTQSGRWPEGSVLLVDTVGLLAELYQKGRYAFVGGSFKKNVHSVMEPLAAGSITFVGPHHGNNREALEFRQIPLGASFGCVNAVADAAELAKQLNVLQTFTLEQREACSTRIQREIEKRSGKSELVVDWILEHSKRALEKLK